MRRFVSASLVVLALAAVVFAQQGDKNYGEPLTISEITPLADIIASPGEYVDKEVRTVGYVYEMCTGSGCWIGVMPSLASDKVVRIAWMQTDVRFPIGEETTGHLVELQGKVITTEQEAEAHAEHMAEAEHEMEHEHAEEAEAAETRTIYLCPMHPDVVQETEGRCPLCNMNLVAKEIPVPTYATIAIEGIGAVVKVKPEK